MLERKHSFFGTFSLTSQDISAVAISFAYLFLFQMIFCQTSAPPQASPVTNDNTEEYTTDEGMYKMKSRNVMCVWEVCKQRRHIILSDTF